VQAVDGGIERPGPFAPLDGWQIEFVKECIECGNALALTLWGARVLSVSKQAA
jgi:hypothetical protein